MQDDTFDLDSLTTLPRPLYGRARALPNQIIAYRHSHPWEQLSYAVQGVIDVQTSRGRFVAPPQRGVWIPAGIVHKVRCSPNTEIRSLYIDSRIAGAMPRRCKVLGVNPLLRELIRRFSQLPILYDEAGSEGRLAQVLLDELSVAPDTGLSLPLPQDKRLGRIARHLQDHPDARDTLADWGVKLGLSDKTLSRLFLRETGLSFRAWRQRLRLLAALPLLEAGDRVTDVALACGYDSTSAFIAAFREHLGQTPGEFFGDSYAARPLS